MYYGRIAIFPISKIGCRQRQRNTKYFKKPVISNTKNKKKSIKISIEIPRNTYNPHNQDKMAATL